MPNCDGSGYIQGYVPKLTPCEGCSKCVPPFMAEEGDRVWTFDGLVEDRKKLKDELDTARARLHGSRVARKAAEQARDALFVRLRNIKEIAS